MTLSNNAIKFLQAQYRAIFKRAYIKGLATAVLLTAGLAAGQAQAVNNPLVDNESGAFTSLDVVYDQDGDYTYSGDEAWANSVTISNGANVTISGSGSVHVNESVLVTGSGTSLTLNSAFNGSISDEGGDESKPLNDPTGAMTISDGATLTVSGTSSYFDDFTVDNATINIGGLVGSDASGSIADRTQLWVGQSDGDSVIDGENTKINLNSHSVLTFGRDAYLRDGVVTFEGADEFDAILQGNKSKTTYLQGTDFSVANGKHGAIFANHINMSAGTITNSGDMIISGRNNGSFSEGATMENATFQAADIVMTGGSIVNAGTLTIGAATEVAWKGGVESTSFTATGGSIKNTGTVNFYAGEITLSNENFTGLFEGSGSVVFHNATTNLDVDGSIDLNELGIISASGETTDQFKISGTSVNLTTDTISLDSAYKASKLVLDTGTLNIDADDSNKRFTFSSGTITVREALNGAAATDRVVIKAESAGSTATLNLIAADQGKITNIDRFNVGWTSKASGTSALNVDGTWDFGGARVTASNNGKVTLGGTVSNISDLMLEKNGAVTVNGTVTVERLLAGEANNSGSTLELNGSLTVTGDGSGDKGTQDYYNDVYLTQSTVNINNGGTLALTTADALDDFITVTKDESGSISAVTVTSSGSNKQEIGGWDSTKVTLKAGGILQLNLAELGIDTLTQAQLTSLKKSLVASGSQGSFDFGDGLTIQLDQALQEAIDSGEVSYSQLSSGGVNDVQGVAEGVTVTVTSKEASTGINLSNGAAAVELQSGTTSLAVNGTLALNGTGGNFVYAENTPDAPVAVSVKANSGVNLTGAGTVGSLTKDSNATGTTAVLTAGQGATQTVQGTIDLAEVTIGTGTVNVTQSVTADELTVNGNLTVSGGAGAVTIGNSGATIAGSLQAGAFTSSGDMSVTGAVLADSIVLGTNKNLTVGDASNSGLVEVETLDLNGGMLLIDPDWTQNASFVAVTSGVNSPDVIDVGGSIGVGRNSVGVFGATNTEAQDALNRLGLLQAGKLDEHGIGSVLYLGQSLAVGNQNDVLVDKTLDNAGLSSAIGSMTTNSGSVTLNNGSALVVSESFSNDLVNDPSQAIFEFAATAGSTVTVTAESGTKIIFDSADILGGDTIKVANSSGATITTTLDQAEITAAGGLLIGTADDTDDTITFGLAQNAASLLYNQSNPIRDMTLDVVGNANNAYDSNDAGVYYIGALNAHNGGADIERTARMALYGGAVQASLMAQQTSTDAISERLGMANPNSALITSNNAQGGGLWLSPVYKNHDSDEFEAEGVNYGADIDLYGLALGADFTTESGVRVGAMFNVGSGDAEGQGIGEGVSNDFDYYGFALYAGVTFGNFALTADAGFTQVSNDLEQAVNYHGVGTLKADTDTQTVSVGVRGEYLFATPWVDVVPHVGVRYTSFDLDSYQAQVDGYTIANADADSMQVFSIPFGVTFSKDMAMGNWLVKPVFDLNLTANAGDDELESDVAFVGVSNVALTTEVMDSFTYGATLGISAQYQESFSFGLNVGYTGSSSADEFGVNANARYTF